MPRPLPLLFALTLLGCAPNRFESVAAQAASAGVECTSSRAVEVERLSSAGLRVETCQGPQFYRCWYARKTMGRTQCCVQVESEEVATATFFTGDRRGATCSELP